MKLKSYLDQIKDAPEDIRILVESIELLQLSLAEIECDQARQQTVLLGTNSTLRSLDYCRRGVERLRRVVDLHPTLKTRNLQRRNGQPRK